MAEDRTDRLIAALENDDPTDALAALGTPAYQDNTRVINAVKAVLLRPGEGPFAHRAQMAALKTLGAIGGPLVIDVILLALDDENSAVRAAAAQTSGDLAPALHNGEPVRAALIAALADTSPAVRGAAAYALGQMPAQHPASAEALLPLLADREDAVRRIAADTLVGLGADAVRSALLHALTDPNSTVRGGAVEILGRLVDEQAREALQNVYFKDKSEWVRSRAQWALSQLKDSGKLIPRVRRSGVPPPPVDSLEVVRAQQPEWPSLKPESRPSGPATSKLTVGQVQALLDQLDVRLAAGEISEATYTTLAARWQARLDELKNRD